MINFVEYNYKDNMDTTSAPFIDNLIAKAQFHSDLLNQSDKDNLLRIIEKLQRVVICGNDELRELWLTAERGSIEDFGDYNEYLEDGEVENQDDFEKIWKEYYPDSVKWYLLSVSHYNDEYFIFINSKLTLHIPLTFFVENTPLLPRNSLTIWKLIVSYRPYFGFP